MRPIGDWVCHLQGYRDAQKPHFFAFVINCVANGGRSLLIRFFKTSSSMIIDSWRIKLGRKFIPAFLYFAFAIILFRSNQWSLLGPFVAVALVLGSGLFVLPAIYSSFMSLRGGLYQKASLSKKFAFAIISCILAIIILIVFFFVLVLSS